MQLANALAALLRGLRTRCEPTACLRTQHVSHQPRRQQDADPWQQHESPRELDAVSEQARPGTTGERHRRSGYRCSPITRYEDSQSLSPGAGHEPDPSENSIP